MFGEAIGFGLVLAGWLTARAVAHAWRPWPISALAMDAAVPLGTFAVLFLATAKPIFAGAVCFVAFGGYGFADHVKRQVLREPIVFTDMSEVIELFRHPDLYLPFAGTGRVLAGAVLAFAAFAAAFAMEPAVFATSATQALLSFAAGLGAIVLCVLLVDPWAVLLRRFKASGEPFADISRFGPFATIGIYGITARAERRARQARFAPAPAPPFTGETPPVILVQSESFFDAGRLDPAMADFLPAFTRLRGEAVQAGRLQVPCWGANTTRSEFAALTGLGDAQTGFDRYNPYHAFARAPLSSLAWTFKARGYKTICIHPFDGRFYGRCKVMPALGFDRMIFQEDFKPEDKVGDYVGDLALARLCERLLAEPGPVFIFIITMQNHGPWTLAKIAPPPLPPALAQAPTGEGLDFYLAGLKDADAMIARLAAALEQRDGLLGFYGDHLPSLPLTFAQLGFTDLDTDYLVWRPGAGRRQTRDIAAHALPDDVLAALNR